MATEAVTVGESESVRGPSVRLRVTLADGSVVVDAVVSREFADHYSRILSAPPVVDATDDASRPVPRLALLRASGDDVPMSGSRRG